MRGVVYYSWSRTSNAWFCCVWVYYLFTIIGTNLLLSSHPKRILIFNCTSGRSAVAFINTLLENIAAQLEKHGLTSILADHPGLFDAVIFCTNVTYADGHFKGGACLAMLR